eukprot:15264472-Ditylum_brightwellii.AAC.1
MRAKAAIDDSANSSQQVSRCIERERYQWENSSPCCMPLQCSIQGETPLHDACCSFSPVKVSFDVVTMLYEFYPGALQEAASDGYTPLHRACETNAHSPFEIISPLIRAYPNALKVKNKNGFTPLHIACKFRAPFEVISLMIKMYPEALEEIDSYHGDTPLHLAFQSSSWFEVISLVIEEYPQAIKKANRMGHTPLH